MGLKTRLLASGKTEDNEFNISLLGFKIAVNDGLTVFNLVDGVVDEFHDESGTDEAEGTNDRYLADCDAYTNTSLTPGTFSAGFTTTTVTEADTSTAQSQPAAGSYTVPCGMTAANIKLFGAGGGSGQASGSPTLGYGGGGGYVEGTLAVTAGQVLDVYVGEGGNSGGSGSSEAFFQGGARGPHGGNGAGGTFVTVGEVDLTPAAAPLAPSIALAAGGGGGGGGSYGSGGGGGGGLTGCAGESQSEQTNRSNGQTGGGGDQEQGGQGGCTSNAGQSGSFLVGGNGGNAGGGGGFYGGGGGGGGNASHGGGGGGGSSYYGHPQITSGATEEAEGPVGGGDSNESGAANPDFNESSEYGEGGAPGGQNAGNDGFVLISGSGSVPSPGGSTTIVSNAFSTSGIVPTTSRIVVFQENVDSITLNTDVVASISRDGGSNFTTATLSDSGYITGSSGQRILTGQAVVSGQPSGQSMRWKLALANNTSKIHGVSLQWS